MSAVAVDVNSATCKSAGCGGEAAWARGPYAGLCLTCGADAKRRFRQSVRASAARMTPEERSERTRKGNVAKAAAAPRVRGVLKDVERAVAELDLARAAELKAADAYRAARKRVAAAEERVNAVRAVLDQAIAGTGTTTDA